MLIIRSMERVEDKVDMALIERRRYAFCLSWEIFLYNELMNLTCLCFVTDTSYLRNGVFCCVTRAT